jgi:N-acetylglutamate synthase-like GNAT family acetyltransferase
MIVERRPPDELCAQGYLAIGTLSVQPPFRNGSLGMRLVEYAKRLALKEKKRLYVESFCEFRKKSYYCALGFTQADPRTYKGKPYHVFYLDPVTVSRP